MPPAVFRKPKTCIAPCWRKSPIVLEAVCGLGILASQTERHEEAVRLLRWETVMRSDSVLLRVALGASLLATGNKEMATVCLRKALELDPACAEAHNTLGCALLERGRHVEAVMSFQAAIKHRPQYPEAYYNLGRTLTTADMPDDAIGMYHKALQLSPTYASALLNLGFLLRDKGDLDAAAECFRRGAGREQQPHASHAQPGRDAGRTGPSGARRGLAAPGRGNRPGQSPRPQRAGVPHAV